MLHQGKRKTGSTDSAITDGFGEDGIVGLTQCMKNTIFSVLILETVFNLWDWYREKNTLISVNIWESSDLVAVLENFIHMWPNPRKDLGYKNRTYL